jgi:small redox-active disulfide protein 2
MKEVLMEIKVLGPGCPNCEEMKRRVEQAVKELGIDATVEKVTDMAEIMKHTMSTPALVVDDKLVHAGKPLPPVEKIKSLLSG